MNKFLKLFVVAVIAMQMNSAFAANWTTWAETSPSLIRFIYPHDNGVTFYLDTEPKTNRRSCRGQFVINVEDKNYSAKVSALMMAYSARKKIEVIWDKDFDNDDKNCHAPVNRFVIAHEGHDL